jgi:maleylpyruvate isomerase
MVLHDYFRSSAAFRVRIALNLKGLQAERRFVHLLRGEQRDPAYLALNPQGFVPMLEVDGQRLTQSLAIIEYLEEVHPEPPLLPRDPSQRAWVRSIALAIACDIHPLNNLRVLKHLGRSFEANEAARNEWYRHWIREGFDALEPQLAARASGTFCVGETPTVADICLVPQVFNALRLELPLDPSPRIRELNEACLALPAFESALPARQPDAS